MHLTPLQHKTLTNYQRFRTSPPTWGGFIRNTYLPYLVLFVCFLGLAGVAYVLDAPLVSALLLGMFAGALLRDCGYFLKVKQIWPALAAVLDWKRIDELLESHKVDQGLSI